MACTIVTTPALGVSDWSSFITQVEYMRRGFMAVSYTNFAASAASAIAAGSMIEVAGSLYIFTETAIDYTGGGSVSSDLYIYAVPSAGGTTCTVVALNAAPVWSDGKQGFYASAASVTRAIGGMYVGSVASYVCKYLYTPEIAHACVLDNRTRPILKYEFTLGEWNMDATAVYNLYPGIPNTKYVAFGAAIINDSFAVVNLTIGGAFSVGSTNTFFLSRTNGGEFDSIQYDGTASTIASRGKAMIWVLA